MELNIKYSDFKNELLKYKSEFEELSHSKIDNEKELNEVLDKFKNIKKICAEYIAQNTSDDISGDLSQLINDEDRYHIPNQKKEFHHSKKEFLDRLKSRMNTIDYLTQLVELSDPLFLGKSYEKERSELSVSEKQDFLLTKLYSLRKTDKYWDANLIFDFNQVTLDNYDEPRGIAERLKNAGYIDAMGHGRGISAKITTTGKAYYEQHIKPKKKTETLKEEVFEIADSKEFDEKIESIKTILEERMSGMNEKMDEILEELKSAKQYIEKMDKKSFGQLVKGKLIDIAVDKVVNKETIIAIAKFFMENPQQLIS